MKEMVSGFRPKFAASRSSDEQVHSSFSFPCNPVVIGDDVWVGANVTILKGARIGSGSVVATGAVVLKGVYPEKSLLAGNPAKVVKIIGEEE